MLGFVDPDLIYYLSITAFATYGHPLLTSSGASFEPRKSSPPTLLPTYKYHHSSRYLQRGTWARHYLHVFESTVGVAWAVFRSHPHRASVDRYVLGGVCSAIRSRGETCPMFVDDMHGVEDAPLSIRRKLLSFTVAGVFSLC